MKIIISESQYNLLRESNFETDSKINKNKKFLTKVIGHDFSDKITQITSSYDVPMEFDEGISSDLVNRMLNFWGPMYLVNVYGKDYLYQDRGGYEWFMDEDGYDYVDDEIPEKLGISEIGLKFSNIINMFFNEEN